MRRPLVLVAALALLPPATALGGCSVHDVAFRQDDRLSFVTPRDRSEVALPVTIRWRVEDFAVPADGSFAVFVDRPPQPPGKPLAWLARNDDACRADDGCPGPAWYADHDVHPTTATSLTLDQLPDRTDGGRERHEVTVVLLDAAGRRISETGWTLELEVRRRG